MESASFTLLCKHFMTAGRQLWTHTTCILPMTSRSIRKHTEIKNLQNNEPFTYLGYISQPNRNKEP